MWVNNTQFHQFYGSFWRMIYQAAHPLIAKDDIIIYPSVARSKCRSATYYKNREDIR